MSDDALLTGSRLRYALGLDEPRVSVVIPALNEGKNLPWVLSRMPSTVYEVVLVDGNSTDDTVAVARAGHASIRIVMQRGRGKGAAIVTGLLAARGDIVVMIDADGSMDPAEIPALVGALLAGADVVKASRRAAGGGSDDLTRRRACGNWVLTVLGRLLFKQRWSELCYGFAAFWADAIPALDLARIVEERNAEVSIEGELERLIDPGRTSLAYGQGFEIEAILFTRSVRVGLRVAEVASWEYRRKFGASKLSTFRDGWRVLVALFRERFRSLPELSISLPSQAREPYPVEADLARSA